MLVCCTYIMWPKWFKPWKIPTLVGSIMIVAALTHCELLHSVCDLKTTQMNMQHNLIWELMLYKLKLVHNVMEAAKNICCARCSFHSTVTRWFKKFYSSWKIFNDQAKSCWPIKHGFWGLAPSYWGKSSKSIQCAQHLTIQCGS